MRDKTFVPRSEKLVASGTDTFFRDLVFLGVMNAVVIFLNHLLYFTIVLPGLFVLQFYNQAITNLFTTTLLLLMIYRVPRFGVLTLHGAVWGVVALTQGFWTGILLSLPAGLLADTMNRYLFRNKKTPWIIISICVFIVLFDLATWWPLTYLKTSDFVQRMVQMDPTFARIVSAMTLPILFSQAVANTVTVIIGGLFGHRIIKKHFNKAGLV